MWRIVDEKGISPDEIKHKWTRSEVLKYNAILDMNNAYKLSLDELDSDEH